MAPIMDSLHSLFGLYSGTSVARFLAFVAPALSGVALRVPKSSHAALRAPARDTFHQPSAPLDPALHWTRVAAVVDGAAHSAQRVRDMQANALAQVDMAEYALGQLISDVSVVMPLPARAGTPALVTASD